jgi:hypothetical protein
MGADGSHVTALEDVLDGPVAWIPLRDDVQACCNREGLLFGLALARRALTMSCTESSRFEIALRFENPTSDLGRISLPGSGDFLLARTTLDGGLVDLTESDIRFWMFLLGLDYILHR